MSHHFSIRILFGAAVLATLATSGRGDTAIPISGGRGVAVGAGGVKSIRITTA